MLRSLLVFASGEEIFSGGPGRAIRSTQFNRCVNSGSELTLGSVCAASFVLSIYAPEGLGLSAGDQVRFYQVDDQGNRLDRGLFRLEEPVAEGPGIYRVTGWDNVAALDKELAPWIAGLTGWPYTLDTFARMVCNACGLELEQGVIPNGSCPVQPFAAGSVTGRQLMRFVAEAAGRYCVADTDGRLRLGWYEPYPVVLGGAGGSISYSSGTLTLPVSGSFHLGELTITGVEAAYADGVLTLNLPQNCHYYQGSLELAQNPVEQIQRVQIGGTGEDVGTVYPQDSGEKNTYRITGNLLLTATGPEDLSEVARNLHAQLEQVSYTACVMSLPADAPVAPGQILQVADGKGRLATVYVMSTELSGQRLVIRADGTGRRDSSAVVNDQSYQALTGKLMELHTHVDGLRVTNRDQQGNLTRMELEMEGIQASVTQQQGAVLDMQVQMSVVNQQASELSIQIQNIRQEGAGKVVTGMGYSFSDQGLRIASTGGGMENLVDDTGMQVTRAGQTLLRADSSGVLATDVSVKNYLQVGEHSRLEDYATGRTACFHT